MNIFNSYVVFDEEGNLIAHAKDTANSRIPEEYFEKLSADIQRRAYVMLVLQEGRLVVRYKVTQPDAPAPTLGPRVSLHA